MSLYWRSASRLLIIMLAGYMALAQPGLPPCWLQAHACEVHPHFSKHHAETPHSHGYLLDLAKANAAQGLVSPLIPAGLLIELLSLGLFLRSTLGPDILEQAWIPLLEPPPPRASLSF